MRRPAILKGVTMSGVDNNDDFDVFAQAFRQMKAQMTPDPALVARLQRTIAGEPRGLPPPAPPHPPPGSGFRGPPRWGAPMGRPAHPRRRPRPGPARLVVGSLVGAAAAVLVAFVIMINPLQGLVQPPPTISPNNPWPDPGAAAAPYAAIYNSLYTSTPEVPSWSKNPPRPQPTANGPDDTMIAFPGLQAYVASDHDSDIVRRSGQYMYIASGHKVVVVFAGGPSSYLVATIDVSHLADAEQLPTSPILDLELFGSTLVVVIQGFAPNDGGWSRNVAVAGVETTNVKTAFYDVSDPANPAFESSVTQSGAYAGSYVQSDTLYVVTMNSLDPATVDPSDPATYVPVVNKVPMTPDNVLALPDVYAPVYTAVTAISVATRTVTDQQAVLGPTGVIYMTSDNIYLLATQNTGELSVSGFAGYGGVRTAIVKIGLNHKEMSVSAQAVLPGHLLTIQDLDAGHNFLVVTATDDPSPAVRLWVLDGSLELVGSIPQVVTGDETLAWILFEGTAGYFQTDRRVITVDVSDPENPYVRGTLSIPALPGYLTRFGDHMLLGAERTAYTSDLQPVELSMLDMSDPYDVSVLGSTTVVSDGTWISVDPSLLFVDAGRGLIGFPVQSLGEQDPVTGAFAHNWDYCVYTWTGSGFEQTATFRLMSGVPTPQQRAALNSRSFTRALEADGSFYVVTGWSVFVYDLGALAPQAEVPIG